MLGGSRPNPFCEYAIVGLHTTFYIVKCDINIATFDKTDTRHSCELTVLGWVVEFFKGITSFCYITI